jgi:predicted nuclease of predicted toxin-antitoxin system
MSRPRFLADHDLRNAIVRGVVRREPAVDFLLARDVGVHERPDDEVLRFAAQHGLIVVSHDVNTMSAAAYARLTRGEPFAGLILVRQQAAIGPVIEDLVVIAIGSELQEWQGQVRFLPL